MSEAQQNQQRVNETISKLNQLVKHPERQRVTFSGKTYDLRKSNEYRAFVEAAEKYKGDVQTARTQKIPRQTVRQRGETLYTIEPGEQPGTYIQTFGSPRQEETPMIIPRQTVRQGGRTLYTIEPGTLPGSYTQTVYETQTGTMYGIAPITRPKPWVDPRAPAPEAEQYLDALDSAERATGGQALETIEGTHPEAYRGFAHVEQEQAVQRYEQTLDIVPDVLTRQRKQLMVEAAEAKIRGDDIEAGLKYGEASLAAAGKGAYTWATWRLRPWTIPQSIAAGAQLLGDPEEFQKSVDKFTVDPMGLYAGVAGGLLGETLAARVQGAIGGKIREANIKSLARSYDPAQQLPFEEELGMAYPEAYTVQRTAHRALEEVKDTGVLPFKEGDPYLFGRKITLKEFEINEAIFKKAYIQTGGGTDLILVPPETPLMPVYKPIPDVEIAPTWKPGVRYTWTDPTLPRKTPRTTPLGFIDVKPVSLSEIAIKETQIMKQIERQLNKTLLKEVPIIKPIITLIETPALIEKSIQIQRQKQKQTALVTEISKMEQVFEEPTFTITDIVTQRIYERPRSRTVILPGLPSKKKKRKKKKRGRKGVFEMRVDFKEPKLPKIADIKFKEPKIIGFGGKKKKKGKKLRIF